MQVKEAWRLIGEPSFARYRKIFSDAIGSRRAELTSGDRGLKKAAANFWNLDKIKRDEGPDAEREEKLRLLTGGLWLSLQSGKTS